MQVNDWGRGAAPRASTGRARGFGSFLRSFTFFQTLSSVKEKILFDVVSAACSVNDADLYQKANPNWLH
ncbi:hypothetical protein [Aeromonas sanarellii]|uniref:hypothetical protein n=1 Tax=Aeromonas sanarellii TaxID=633415 RepID=UPI0038CFC13C